MFCWKNHKKQAWLMNSVVWSNASGGFLMSQVDWSISAPTRFVLPVSWVVAGEVFALPLAWPPPHHYAGWWFSQLAWLHSPVVWGSWASDREPLRLWPSGDVDASALGFGSVKWSGWVLGCCLYPSPSRLPSFCGLFPWRTKTQIFIK